MNDLYSKTLQVHKNAQVTLTELFDGGVVLYFVNSYYSDTEIAHTKVRLTKEAAEGVREILNDWKEYT